jgi:ubiquinone/menaquinone biosynthesis C-methylase UbiE
MIRPGRASYFMENEEEALRLDMKTDVDAVRKQALWAGVAPGMRVCDMGCGSGKATAVLREIVGDKGMVVGVDFSEDRIAYARERYSVRGVEFTCRRFDDSLEGLDFFDLVWMRFVLEYFPVTAPDIVRRVSCILKPGGTLCLLDLDHNCLNHHGMPARLERTFCRAVSMLEEERIFDPYAGRKLYSYLFDLGFENIDVGMFPHHLIFGPLKDVDGFNWTKKIEVVARKLGHPFDEYPGGYEEFLEEFKNFFESPRRFTYTPLIGCKGQRPLTVS